MPNFNRRGSSGYRFTRPRIVLTSNSKSLAIRWRVRAKNIDKELYNSQVAVAKQMVIEGVRLSSFQGYKIGKDKGYPYAVNRRPGYPPLPGPPHLINIQKGGFVKAWTYRVTKSGNGLTVTVYNKTPYSKFMLGTKKMIPRPIAEFIAQAGRQRQKGAIEVAVRKAVAQSGGTKDLPVESPTTRTPATPAPTFFSNIFRPIFDKLFTRKP